jgi:hypothetical protein
MVLQSGSSPQLYKARSRNSQLLRWCLQSLRTVHIMIVVVVSAACVLSADCGGRWPSCIIVGILKRKNILCVR